MPIAAAWISLSITCLNHPFLSGVDSVGTVSASLVTYAAIQALQPDLIINAGTAGGFKVCSSSLIEFENLNELLVIFLLFILKFLPLQ